MDREFSDITVQLVY